MPVRRRPRDRTSAPAIAPARRHAERHSTGRVALSAGRAASRRCGPRAAETFCTKLTFEWRAGRVRASARRARSRPAAGRCAARPAAGAPPRSGRTSTESTITDAPANVHRRTRARCASRSSGGSGRRTLDGEGRLRDVRNADGHVAEPDEPVELVFCRADPWSITGRAGPRAAQPTPGCRSGAPGRHACPSPGGDREAGREANTRESTRMTRPRRDVEKGPSRLAVRPG